MHIHMDGRSWTFLVLTIVYATVFFLHLRHHSKLKAKLAAAGAKITRHEQNRKESRMNAWRDNRRGMIRNALADLQRELDPGKTWMYQVEENGAGYFYIFDSLTCLNPVDILSDQGVVTFQKNDGRTWRKAYGKPEGEVMIADIREHMKDFALRIIDLS